jgi:hypothetical protein
MRIIPRLQLTVSRACPLSLCFERHRGARLETALTGAGDSTKASSRPLILRFSHRSHLRAMVTPISGPEMMRFRSLFPFV